MILQQDATLRRLAETRRRLELARRHVRANLPRLSDPYWHKRVKRGYANGRETAQFVERVSQFAAILEAKIPNSRVARD